METKVCSGKHGCGQELSIEMFGKRKVKRYYETLNETVIYTYLEQNCKKCRSKLSSKRYFENIEEEKEKRRQYRKTDKYKISSKEFNKRYSQTKKYKKYQKKWRKINKNHIKEYHHNEYLKNREQRIKNAMIFRKQYRKNLTFSYVNEVLKINKIFNPIPELIQAKRAQLQLYRYVKENRTISTDQSNLN